MELPLYNVNYNGSLNCKLIFYYIINKTKCTPRDVQTLSLQLYKLEFGGNVGGGGNGGGGDGGGGDGGGGDGGGGVDGDGGDDDDDDDDDSSSFDYPSFVNKCR